MHDVVLSTILVIRIFGFSFVGLLERSFAKILVEASLLFRQTCVSFPYLFEFSRCF